MTFVQRLRESLDELGISLQDRGQVWAVVAVAGAVVLVAVWLYARASPAPIVTGSGAGVRGSVGGAQASPAGRQASESSITVHVAGAVRRPGVVTLWRGARIDDAVRLAGGPVAGADLDAINLAAKVSDGQQVAVPRRGAVGAAGVPGQAGSAVGGAGTGAGVAGAQGSGAGGSGGGLVDLNTATIGDFDSLPGIGPVLAQRIFSYRSEHGRFNRVEDLQQIEGIGPKKFAQLRTQVTCKP